MHLPCGRCYPCTMRRVSGWSFRLMQEDKRAYTSSFVTLTYNTKHVPITRKGYMNLSKEHLQSFFKRLRYYEKEERRRTDSRNNSPIRYYACGEYGSKHNRPHYHIILFNASIQAIEKAWTIEGKQIGDIYHGYVSEASVGYCLKYINKPSRIPIHKNDDRIKEFALMSKKLGDNYINESTKKWHLSNLQERYFLPLKDGKKASIPRYYKEKIYHQTQRQAIGAYQKLKALEETPLTEEERIEIVKINSYKLKKQHDERTTNEYH